MFKVWCSELSVSGFGFRDSGLPESPGLFDSGVGAAPSLEGDAPREFVKGVQHHSTRGKLRVRTGKRDPCGTIGVECKRGVLGMG